MRATSAGAALRERLHALSADLGPYPHAVLTGGDGRKKQTTRMLKVQCEDCGCLARMTRQWLDSAGAPTCGCGGTMREGRAER